MTRKPGAAATRRPGAATRATRQLLAWSGLLLVLALYCLWRVTAGNAFESNILSLMPDAGRDLELTRFAAQRFDQSAVVLLSHADDDTALALATQLGEQLTDRGATLAEGYGDPLQVLREGFAPFRHQLLSDELRQELLTRSAAELAEAQLRELYSPVPSPRLYNAVDDPFNLGGRWLQPLLVHLDRWTPGEIPSLRDDSGTTWQVLHATLGGNALDTRGQGVAAVVDAFETAHPDATLLRSGLVFHAAEAAELARREISTIGVGSLLGILILVAWVFRSRQALAAIGFTLLSSVLIALTACFAIFGQIHLVTLAFGSTLLGLAVDFCFHFLVKHQALGEARAAGRAVRRGVLVSASSSIAAYLVQLWSPFPGLHQFAVFMAAGLIGAWIAVAVLWHSYGAPPSQTFERFRHFYPRYLATPYQRLTRPRWPGLLALLLALPLLAGWIVMQGGRDDIRLLNASSIGLLQQEQRVQTLLGGIDAQRYWVVEGDSEQQVLERMEALLTTLEGSDDRTALLAASQWVPSLERQRRDHALVTEKLYGEGGALAILCARLGSDCQQWKAVPTDFERGLTPAQLPAEVFELFPALGLIDSGQGLVLTFHGSTVPEALQQEAAGLPGVRAVDQVAQLSGTLAHLRVEAGTLLALFIALFAAVCVVGFGRRGLLVAGSVVVSLGVSLALSGRDGITLFHILALLLVLGLAVDTAVFYLELGLNGDTWLAATLAIATSMLAFGLLSLSQMPILQQFGSVVAVGLLCAWLITPLLLHLLDLSASTPLANTHANPRASSHAKTHANIHAPPPDALEQDLSQ